MTMPSHRVSCSLALCSHSGSPDGSQDAGAGVTGRRRTAHAWWLVVHAPAARTRAGKRSALGSRRAATSAGCPISPTPRWRHAATRPAGDTTAVAQRHVTPRERLASSPPPSSSSHEPPRPCPVAANQYSPLRLSVASRVSPRPRCGRVELRGRGSRRKRDRALEQATNGAATIAEYPAARGEGDERVATGE